METQPRLIVLNGFESVLTDAFSSFNLSRDPAESVEKLSDARLWVKKKKLEFSNFKNSKSPYSQVIKFPDHFYKR